MSPDRDRRATLAWLARAGIGSIALPGLLSGCADGNPIKPVTASGYGLDPTLTAPHVPWPLTFTDAEKAVATVLADVMLPADARSPAASTLGVPAFVDEWVSAPYTTQRADRIVILQGLRWLDRAGFAKMAPAMADRMTGTLRTSTDTALIAFFARFRAICLVAYYSTDVGMADIGYVGNQASETFDGPPAAVLERIGV